MTSRARALSGGLFGGYLYLNAIVRPGRGCRGVRVSEVDRQLFGSGGAMPRCRPPDGPGDRNPVNGVRAFVGLTHYWSINVDAANGRQIPRDEAARGRGQR